MSFLVRCPAKTKRISEAAAAALEAVEATERGRKRTFFFFYLRNLARKISKVEW